MVGWLFPFLSGRHKVNYLPLVYITALLFFLILLLLYYYYAIFTSKIVKPWFI